MKALVKNGSHVSVTTRQRPDVYADTDVLIRIALAGMCRTDMYVAEGRIPSKDPLVLGHEFSGIIEKTGTQCPALRQGDRVAVMPLFPRTPHNLKNGLPSYADATMMGIHHDGAFGEFVVVPSYAVYKIPDNVSLMQGAYMEPIAASLAVLNASISPHQKGLIYGDNRISRLTERIMNLKGFDNLDVCNSKDDLPDNTYDFIVETLATTESMTKMIRAVKPGGRIVLKSRQHAPVTISINDLVLKDISMEAVSYGNFQEGIDMVASGQLKVDDLFGDVFSLDRFETVFSESRRGESRKLFLSAVSQDVWAH